MFLALVLFMLFLSLQGCSLIGLDAQSLMHAPKPTGKNETDIQNVLEKTAGDSIILKYPTSGDYRSAIMTHDLCGSNEKEAIAFYQKGDGTTGTNIMFMEKGQDGWQNIGLFNNPASNVERICFGDVNGDGKDDVIVGWGSSLNNTGNICVYYYKDNKMNELQLNQSYTEMAVMDFDGDGRDEIFTANITMGDQQAIARLIKIKNGEMELMGTAPLDAGVTKYVSINAGLINEKQNGIVLDGIKDANTMVTELLYWDKKTKRLTAPFYDEATKSDKSTERQTSVVSKDINGDKIIEIPIVTLLPGNSGTSVQDAGYLTSWHRYDTGTGTLIRVMSMVIDSFDGYWFSVPDMWRGKITTKMSTSTRTLTFYEWLKSGKDASGTAGQSILKIQVFTKKEWASGNTKGFFKLAGSDNIVYAASIPSPDNPLSITQSEVKEAFSIIND